MTRQMQIKVYSLLLNLVPCEMSIDNGVVVLPMVNLGPPTPPPPPAPVPPPLLDRESLAKPKIFSRADCP